MKIFTHGNYIHFNEKINKQTVVKLIEEIELVNTEISNMKQKYHTDTIIPILLFINSWGGCVDSALGVCNMIENNVNPIITVINGQSASAGTMLSIVGHRRLIYPLSYAMIHEGSSYVGGDGNDIEADMHNMDLIETKIKNMYMKNSKLTSKKYDELCIDDKSWTPNECLEHGLVDKIIMDGDKLRDWNWLLNIPTSKRKDIDKNKRRRNKKNNIKGNRNRTNNRGLSKLMKSI